MENGSGVRAKKKILEVARVAVGANGFGAVAKGGSRTGAVLLGGGFCKEIKGVAF